LEVTDFLLVNVMLLVLLALVPIVLCAPIPGVSTSVDASVVLDYRKSILVVLITAFGAWMGAGAAYCFGRENLREASQSLLAMREPSGEERLRRTLVREVAPRAIDWVVKIDDTVFGKLESESLRWFIPLIDSTIVLLKCFLLNLVPSPNASQTTLKQIKLQAKSNNPRFC